MTILEAVGDYLQAQGQGTLGTNIFLAVMPESPDSCVCVFETAGFAPQFTMGAAAWAVDQPGIQVICRGPRGNYPAARDKADAIRGLLGAVVDSTLSSVNVMRIAPDGAVLSMGEDENGRPMVSVNFSCQVRP